MFVLGKPYNTLSADDVKRLKDERVRESKTLEYKESLPGGSDQDKREFLADVSAMANTVGGTIVFGIAEEKDENGQNLGYPGELVGLSEFNADRELLRLENILRGGLDPPLSSFGFHSVNVDQRSCLLLGIGRSLFAPHMITFKNDSRFWMRGNSGRQQMSIDELRRAFMEVGSWETEAEQFRVRRVSGEWRQRVPAGLDSNLPAFIHIVPLGRRGLVIDIKSLVDSAYSLFSRVGSPSARSSFNLDGYMVYDGDAQVSSYMQFFRNGAVETYYSSFTHQQGDLHIIDAFSWEHNTLRVLNGLFQLLEVHGIGFPIAVFLSFLGTKGYPLWPPNNSFSNWKNRRFDSDRILLPALVFDSMQDVRTPLRPAFDMLWQAAGWPECPGYLERRTDK